MNGVWHSAWIALGRKRLRTLLTISSIAIGTAMVVLVLCIGKIGTAAIQKELQSMGVDGLSVSASDGLPASALYTLRKIPAVREAMPLSLQFATLQMNGKYYSVVGCGVDSGADQVISLELLHGRMLLQEDLAEEASVCVVDETLALDVFGRSNVVGETLSVRYESGSLETKIVGVTATGSSLLQSVTSLIPYMIYLPYTTQQSVTGMDRFDQIAVRLKEGVESEETEKEIQRLLQHDEDVGAGLATEDLSSQRNRLNALMGIVSLALTAIAGVSLLVSGFGVLTVMLSSVNERTREIGIKKAIGATKTRILTEFLAGAWLLSLLGALLGLVLGVGAVWLGSLTLGVEPQFPVWQLLGVVLLTLLLGTVFGAYPAYQAAGLRPVEALRCEG